MRMHPHILWFALLVFVADGPAAEPPAVLSTGPARRSRYALPIRERSFLMGTAGFAPAHFPKMDAEDMSQFWKDVAAAGELHGVHTDWRDLKILELTAKSVSVDLVVGLGFQRPAEWKRDVEALTRTIKEDVLGRHRRVKYLFVGNEVTRLYEDHPAEFPDFVAAYKQVYADVRKAFPAVKVFTTFQYESLLGEAYVRGLPKRDPQWSLLKQFDGHLDLVGITTYPYLQYTDPKLIPDTYFSRIAERVDRPLAITETAWMARSEFGGRLKPLSDQGYTGSEDEQARFVQRLAQLSGTAPIEFTNWLHVNDFAPWEDGDTPANPGLAMFISTALKYHNGREKAVWKLWLDLKGLPQKTKVLPSTLP